jgi:hypothetical protein
MQRVRIVLTENEYSALVRLAERDLRPLPDEVRAVVRDRLRLERMFTDRLDDGPQSEVQRCAI